MEADELLTRFNDFFKLYYHSKIKQNIREGKNRVTIDFPELTHFDPELSEELINRPDDVLEVGGEAIKNIEDNTPKIFNLRVRGEIPAAKYRIRDLRVEHLDKFMTIEGTIETKTDIRYNMTCTKYECPNCGNVLDILQREEDIKEPTKCSCGRKGKFKLLSKEVVNCFTLRLQELSSHIKYGSEMKMISVLCKEDLTDTIIEERLIEGMRVRVNGVFKEKTLIKNQRLQTQLVTYLEANYIQLFEESFYDIELTEKDIQEIKKFSKSPELMKTIYSKLFYGVHGYDNIKEALVLQSFGGVSDYESVPSIRGDVHILLVGDPGENKSAFLEFTTNFNPKSVLVVGKSVSAVGLSGAVIKDELTGAFVLKPGAIPLANNGIIMIDELDKMKEEDRDILHEPMEQQRISISKANIADRKMLARESFLISMNPRNGYFNDNVEIYKQIELPPTLVSRFDLVFVMKKNRSKDDKTRLFEKMKAKIMMTRGRLESQTKLKEFHLFMRRYIAYARQNIRPKFDKFLEEEYLPEKFAGFDHERKTHDEGDTDNGFPITPRHIWIIRRLAEARRRMFLGEVCTTEDVDYAIHKIKESLEEIAIDKNTGRIDQEWVVDGVSSQKKKIISIFEEICDEVQLDNGDILIEEFYKKMEENGFKMGEVEEYVQKKKNNGDIFFPKRNIMRRVE